MAIAHVASDLDRAASSGADATTGAIDSSGANLLVVSQARYNSGGATTLSDSKGNTWTPRTEYGTGNKALAKLYYATNSPTVGSGHTFTLAGEYDKAIGVLAFSGAHATTPYDTENGNSDTTVGSLSIQPGSVTPSEDNCVVVTCLHSNARSTAVSISGYTALSHVAPYSAGIAYVIQTTATATNPTWTWTSDYVFCAASIAVFKSAAGGGGGGTVIPVFMNQYRQRWR